MLVAILGVLVAILIFVLAIYGAVSGEIRRKAALDDHARRMEHSR